MPKKEDLQKYDPMFRALTNSYTWEDLNSKILMECSFNFKDTIDKYSFNDKDELEVNMVECKVK